MQGMRTIEALPACCGSLSTLPKEFWNSFKTEPWYTLGTLWEHPICQAWWIMHYITLWEHMFTNARLVYRNNETQNTKGILSWNSFFMILQCPSCIHSMCGMLLCWMETVKGCTGIGCCHCVWSPVEANLSNWCHMENLVTLSLSKNEKVELTWVSFSADYFESLSKWKNKLLIIN
jgi:hypothetical protein